jgi:thioredoxin reductase (NADPH)
MSSSIENIVIVGTGSAGLTAAVYAGRANLSPLLIEGTLPGGQLTTTSEVENFPGFPEGIDGFQLMDNLRKQAAKFGARFEQGRIGSVDFSGQPLKLRTGEREILARSVIVATGASPRMMGVPGEKEYFGGKGVTTCATCDGAFYRNMDVVVVGGGDSACEEALFLTRFASSVTLIHRRDTLRASRIMAERTLAHPKIRPAWNSILTEVLGSPEAGVNGVRVKDAKTGAGRVIPCKGVFMAIGHVPNTEPFAQALDVDASGYLLPAGGSQVKTKVPGVFVAGDCADHIYRQAITAAGMGCQAAIEAERWLAEHGA